MTDPCAMHRARCLTGPSVRASCKIQNGRPVQAHPVSLQHGDLRAIGDGQISLRPARPPPPPPVPAQAPKQVSSVLTTDAVAIQDLT